MQNLSRISTRSRHLGRPRTVLIGVCRLSTQAPASPSASLSRSYLYVPSSSDRMLEKSITAGTDVIIYDLEDSVSPAPEDKLAARTRLRKFLEVSSMVYTGQEMQSLIRFSYKRHGKSNCSPNTLLCESTVSRLPFFETISHTLYARVHLSASRVCGSLIPKFYHLDRSRNPL